MRVCVCEMQHTERSFFSVSLVPLTSPCLDIPQQDGTHTQTHTLHGHVGQGGVKVNWSALKLNKYCVKLRRTSFQESHGIWMGPVINYYWWADISKVVSFALVKRVSRTATVCGSSCASLWFFDIWMMLVNFGGWWIFAQFWPTNSIMRRSVPIYLPSVSCATYLLLYYSIV